MQVIKWLKRCLEEVHFVVIKLITLPLLYPVGGTTSPPVR